MTSPTEYSEHSVRFSQISISLHWLMLILIAMVYATVELKGLFPKGGDFRQLLKPLHSGLGIVILMLVIVRIAYNIGRASPPIVPSPPVWQKLAGKLTHYLLYLFMVAVPVLGWLMLSAKGKPIPFFGLELPALIGSDRNLGKRLENLHETFAQVGYFFIGLHAIAALFHHYIARDNTLIRMLPSLGRRK